MCLKSVDAISRRIQQLHEIKEQCRTTKPSKPKLILADQYCAKCAKWTAEQDALRRERANSLGVVMI